LFGWLFALRGCGVLVRATSFAQARRPANPE